MIDDTVENIEISLNNIPKGWTEGIFSDFIDINPLVPLKKNNEYSFIEMKDLNANLRFVYSSSQKVLTSGARFQNGDTLFARITPCLENGKICQVSGLSNSVGFGSTEFLVFRGKENLFDNNYVFYLCQTDTVRDFAEKNMSGSSGRQRVAKEAFNKLYIAIPPLPEQKIISEILSSFDNKIELNRKLNITLEQILLAIWQMMFSKSDNVHTELSEFVEFNPKVQIRSGQECIFVEMKDLSNIHLSISDYTTRVFNAGPRFENGDTLLARITPCLENGKTAFVNFLPEGYKGFGSSEFIVMRAKNGISPQYVYCLARDVKFRTHAIKSMSGTSGRQRVNVDSLKAFLVNKVDKSTMEEFDVISKSLVERIRINTEENRNLLQQRNLLLHKLLNGKIRI
jgi:type I restriction enzyme S subunit